MRTDSSMKVNHRRRQFIGGSDARIIMGDDEPALLRLWREKRGEIEPEDLSDDLLVQLGTVTEELNRSWYEKNTGQVVTEVQRQVFHAVHRWMAATLSRASHISSVTTVTRTAFDALVEKCLRSSPEKLTRKYGLSYADVENLVPSLGWLSTSIHPPCSATMP